MRAFSKSWFSTAVHYLTLAWTIFCIIGTWFVIIKYGILSMGFIAVVVTFFFAATIWIIPLTVLVLLSLYIAPPEESPSFVTFKELIKRGMRRSSG
jgi:hypothetical protein